MDISLSLLAPRHAAIPRPSGASAGTPVPPPAAIPAHSVPPASPAQGGLVARGFPDARGIDLSEAARVDGAIAPDGSPERVLKPWGVPMLPAEDEAPPGQTSGPKVDLSMRRGAAEPRPASQEPGQPA